MGLLFCPIKFFSRFTLERPTGAKEELIAGHICSNGSVWHKVWPVAAMEVYHLDVSLRDSLP
jgi:hypothetical protein